MATGDTMIIAFFLIIFVCVDTALTWMGVLTVLSTYGLSDYSVLAAFLIIGSIAVKTPTYWYFRELIARGRDSADKPNRTSSSR